MVGRHNRFEVTRRCTVDVSIVVGRLGPSALFAALFVLLALMGAPRAHAATVVIRGAERDCSFDCTSETLQAGDKYYGAVGDVISYTSQLRFDITSVLPAGAGITGARMALYRTDSIGGTNLSAHPILGPWDSAAGIGPATDTTLVSAAVGWNFWNITQLTRDWFSGSAPNHGVMVRDGDTNVCCFVTFASSESVDPSKRPYLEITYVPDTTPPDVHLDGGMYEDRATELVPDLYDLAIDARDGAGVTQVQVFVDGALAHVAGPDQPCAGSACDVDTDFDLDAGSFTGTHSFEVRATDGAGNVNSVAWAASFNGTPFPIDDLLNGGFESMSDALPTASGDGAGCGFVRSRDARILTKARPTAIVNGHWKGARGQGPETTEYFEDRRYRVTRCRPDGKLVISQLVGPVSVPDGIALLELGRTVPEGADLGTSILEYASPTDPVFARAWARGRARALANTIPPTKP